MKTEDEETADRFAFDPATVEVVDSQCQHCKHYPFPDSTETPFWCPAFPTGIPGPITINRVDHRLPVEGDGGIRWEPKTPTDVHPLEKK